MIVEYYPHGELRRICMFEYLPWSRVEYGKCLEKYKNGILSILDIELGGECNFCCVYCDSPDRRKTCLLQIDYVEYLMKNGEFDWVYVCGLGEPTFNNNYKILILLLELCEKYHLRCSIFSNLSNLNDELLGYIERGTLYVLFKYDSRQSNIVRTLYGTIAPEEQLSAIKRIAKYVRFQDGLTNIAASIVPTQLNYDEISNIVKECIDNKIYPLLGELEHSGKGETNYNNLCLSKDELKLLKCEIEAMWHGRYEIPVCPAVICGVHINSSSDITVDSFSGLSCHWFWLEEPKTKVVLPFNSKMENKDIYDSIIQYRNKQFNKVSKYLGRCEEVGLAFGGCGGNVEQLFKEYLEAHGR